MTISSQVRTAGPFACNGSTTVFPFAFKVFTASDVSVVFRDTASGAEVPLVLNIDYTVSLNADQNANPGGSVSTIGPAFATGATLTLTSKLQYLQPTDLTNQGAFYPKVISDALDRLTIFVQQVLGIANRALKFPISDGNLDGTLPGKDQRKGRVLVFHETTGLPIAGPSIGDVIPNDYIGEDLPVNPFNGMRWYKPSEATTFVYYVDGDSGQWVQEPVVSADSTLELQLAAAGSTVLVSGVEASTLVGQLKSLGATEFFDLAPTVDAATSVNISAKPLKTYCTGVAESSSLSADYNYTKLDGEGGFSTTAANNRGWLASLTGSNWIQVLTPFGVIVGDSIAEGHPSVHGRLHQSYVDPTFNDAILNAYGSPAYALSQRTGMHWYNAGIGGQTTTEILARFDRDALGQTVAVGDGRPNSTLPAKPVWVWVNAGINDVSALTATSVTKTNLLKMAIKALNAGVNIGFNTIGPVDIHNATQRAMQDDINNFILTVLPLYGCHTFDFHSWFVDPSDSTKTNPRFSADGVHPNKTGYNNYVARLLSDCNLPIYLNGLAIESYGETYSSNYRAPTTVEFEDNAGLSGQFGMSNQFGVFNPSLNLLTSALLKVYVRNGVDGINGARHSGFSNIHPLIGYRSQKQEPSAGVEKALGGHIVKVAGTWQATTTTQALGVSSVSATSTGVWVTFTVGVNRPMVSMTGSSTPAIYAATPQGAGNTQVRVRIFDRSTGAEIDPTTMPDNTGFNLLAFGVI